MHTAITTTKNRHHTVMTPVRAASLERRNYKIAQVCNDSKEAIAWNRDTPSFTSHIKIEETVLRAEVIKNEKWNWGV